MGLSKSHGEALRLLLGRIALLELARPVLARAGAVPCEQNHVVILATYDETMRRAADRMSIPLLDLL